MDTTQTNEIEKHKRTQHYEVLRELGDCYTSVGNYSQAQRCYEKAGFTREGTRREAIFRDGRYHDEHVMSILREEFLVQEKRASTA